MIIMRREEERNMLNIHNSIKAGDWTIHPSFIIPISFQKEPKHNENCFWCDDSNNVLKRVVVFFYFIFNFSFSQFNPILIVFFRDVRDLRVNGCESFILPCWCHIVIRQFMFMELFEDLYVVLITIMGRQFIIPYSNKISIRKTYDLSG